jgi:uncharacterized membrane protein
MPFPGARAGSYLVDLNEHGMLLGRGEDEDDLGFSYVWQDGVVTRLGDELGGMTGFDLNDRGHVAGLAGRDAAVWRDGVIERLTSLSEGLAIAYAINDRDVAVGARSSGSPDWTGLRAVVWGDGTAREISVAGGGWSEATEINDRGQVAGLLGRTRADGTPVRQVYVWTDGALTRLGPEVPVSPDTAPQVRVLDQNARGQVLTQAPGPDGAVVTTLWTPPARRS